jgi:hypothetical protein
MLSPRRNSRNSNNTSNDRSNGTSKTSEVNNTTSNTSRHISIKPNRNVRGVYNRNYSSDSDIVEMRPNSADERLKLETVVEIGN